MASCRVMSQSMTPVEGGDVPGPAGGVELHQREIGARMGSVGSPESIKLSMVCHLAARGDHGERTASRLVWICENIRV